MVYNLTGIAQNATDVLQFTQGVNEVLTFGWLGTLILIGLVVVMFTSFMFITNDSNKSIAASAFIAFSLAFMLRAMSLISDFTMFTTLLLAAAAIGFIWKGNN